MPRIHLERTIAASPARVFDWLTDPVNLAAAPMALRAGWESGSSAPGKGAVRRVTAIGAWFREEITSYDRPHSYSYLIVGSFPPIDHEGGTLTMTPVGDGTHVDWLSNYTHPARAGGRLLEKITLPLLRSSLRAVLNACAKELER